MRKTFKIFIILTGLLISQTTEQIKQAKDIIRRTGMSEQQVRNAAKAQGYSEKEIDAAIQKDKTSNIESRGNLNELFDQNLEGQSSVKNIETAETELYDSDYNSDNTSEDSELKLESQNQSGRQGLEYFGYDIFSRDPSLFQSTSVGVVDPNYLIGPGDEIIVMLWGETQFRQVLEVDREGSVFIPEIGQVFVNGLNLTLLESKLFRVFSQSYASLDPQGRTPTTFLDVSLGNLRPLRIQVLGEVSQPGAYTVSPTATLFSALYYFNGPSNLGSLRDIHLIRGGRKIASIDFYDYLLTGKRPKDQKLQLDDVIFIPRRLKTATIEGEINRSGIYELKPSETFNDLIAIAGGLKITAYLGRAQIDRIVPFEKRADLGMDRMYKDVNLQEILSPNNDFLLQDGDRIQVFSILNTRQNVVDLRGSVTRPGSYDLGESLKLSELIKKADGPLGDAYLQRVDIVRIKPDFSEELIKLNLAKAMDGDLQHDIKLQVMDRVQVYGITEMVPKTFVTILGHIKKPGKFVLQDNMTLYDLIFKGGGFVDEEFKNRTFLERADLIRLDNDNSSRTILSFNLGDLIENPKSENDIPLQPNDIVRIYNKDIFVSNETVEINGVVRSPGTYNLKMNMSLKDLILEAGGLNEDIYRYRVEIARINPLNENLQEYAKTVVFNISEKFSISSPILNDFTSTDYSSPNADNFYLKPYDLITVRPDPFFKYQRKVTISGEVLYPGEYVILKANEKITDIINRAGGLSPNAYPDGSIFIRDSLKVNTTFDRIIKNPKSDLNFKVQDGDQIIINRSPNVIRLVGAVNSPGIHKFIKGKRLRSYLQSAGGLSPDADRDNIWVEYPNGNSKKLKRFSLLSPGIIDGSSIIIGMKKEEEPFDHTEYAKEVTAIIANLAQAITVVVLAFR